VADETSVNFIGTNRRQPDADAQPPIDAQVREDDLEPHAGLRYVARLFKVLAILLIVLMVAEVIIGLTQQGTSSLPTLMIEATRLIVFAGFLWGAGDIALMLIESNHDLRAARILLGRIHYTLREATSHGDAQTGPRDDTPVERP
jgi:hypothetical protein